MAFEHIPVMLDQVIEMLKPREGGVFLDGTLGGGGHSQALLARGAAVYGVDRDSDALTAATQRLRAFPLFHAIYGNFHDLPALAKAHGIPPLDGVLLDLGVSSFQLDTPSRGFSYHADAPLDMRMDQSQAFSARELVNEWPQKEIARILWEYGEERWAERIAAIIVEHREQKPLETTADLVRAVDAAIPRRVRNQDKGHSAQKTFQAVRIAVNDELGPLAQALEDAVSLLKPGGRLAVITFHSLEDRVVKLTFRRLEHPCTCPPELPVCICGKKPTVCLPQRNNALTPSQEEIKQNPRARSAKLRVAEKL